MKACVNCKNLAEYDYEGIVYCDKHLPRFLRKKGGVIAAKPLNQLPPAPPAFIPPPVEVPPPYVEVAEVVEEAPKPSPKKRPKPAPPVVEEPEEVATEEAPEGE